MTCSDRLTLRTPGSGRSVGFAGALAVVAFLLLTPARSDASTLPPNDLWKEDNRFAPSAIAENQFNAILGAVFARYQGQFAMFGATFVINRFWNDPTVNAFAERNGNNWIINMYGGLARRPEVTADGFTMVACHEIGHHLGGYPFYTGSWAATEGESDNYATQACGRLMWSGDPANADIASRAPQTVRNRCDAAWGSAADRDLCARIALAGKSLADLLGALEGRTVDYDRPDTRVVTQTVSTHPPAQCRLDTYLQAAQCTVGFNFNTIPGIGDPIGPHSPHAELSAAAVSCMPISSVIGTPGYNGHDRPLCWFAPQLH